MHRGLPVALLSSICPDRNVKLRDIAVDVVTTVGGQPPADKPRFS